MIQWYYGTKDNQQRGPVDSAVILEKLQNNELTKDSFIWREGMEQWQRLSTLMNELEPPSSSSINNSSLIITQETHYTQPISSNTGYTTASSDTGSHHIEDHSTVSPYSAPASDFISHTAVQGGEVIYAGFWRRAAACLVDGLLVGIIAQVLGGIIGLVSGIIMATTPDTDIGNILIILISSGTGLGLGMVYYAWFHSATGMATPGKLLVGIKVVRPDGERITFLRGIGRFFATYISGFILCIGYIMAAFTDRKQALHDMMCDTWVVDKWAFTDRPQLQQRGFGTATVVILSIFGILFAITFVVIIIVIGAAIASSR